MTDSAHTFLDKLVAALEEAGQYNRHDQVAPVVVLWPDEAQQWAPLLPDLRRRLPLLTLGEYDADQRTGPAVWIRCMIGRTLPDDRLPDDVIPIIYLPGYGKSDLRAIDECPVELQPLAELQYRGVVWVHPNGRDWTVTGFLHQLDAPVAADKATRSALDRALPELARERVIRLQREAPLRAEFFNQLLHPDPVSQMLRWLDNPQGYQAGLSAAQWDAFCALSRQKYGTDPEKDGPLSAAGKLGQPTGEWAAVWERFAEAPRNYPGIPDLLARAQPQQLPLFRESSPTWPAANTSAENNLRASLAALRDDTASAAREAVWQAEDEHGQRRNWVWAELGQAPLALALEHLVTLAELSEQPLKGTTTDQLASDYAAQGYKIDSAVLQALAAVSSQEDVSAVKSAIIPLYRPWLEQSARRFQTAVLSNSGIDYQTGEPVEAESGSCILFCDALRFDVGRQLADSLAAVGHKPDIDWQLAALPPVTSTAKPAISPAASAVTGGHKPGLVPADRDKGTSLGIEVLRRLLDEQGYQVLKNDELGDPSGRAWTEFGAIDSYGHGHGWKIAHHVAAELRALADRVTALLNHGWQQVVVVTDHGWLLVPDGMPKADLPQHLTVTRKGRCAVLKADAVTSFQSVPWHWNDTVRIAVAPDIHCFEAGKEYEHGGLSVQECVVPVIRVRSSGVDARPVSIASIKWRGLRCNVDLSGDVSDVAIDLRLQPNDAATSVVADIKSPDEADTVSLLVPDDSLEGTPVFVVVLREQSLQAQKVTVVGGE